MSVSETVLGAIPFRSYAFPLSHHHGILFVTLNMYLHSHFYIIGTNSIISLSRLTLYLTRQCDDTFLEVLRLRKTMTSVVLASR
jgi:hypothetical protein